MGGTLNIVSFQAPHVCPPPSPPGLESFQDYLALQSQHVRKTGRPIGMQDSKQSCDLRVCTPESHENQSELCKLRRRADSAMPRNPARESRPFFGLAHVRVWGKLILISGW